MKSSTKVQQCTSSPNESQDLVDVEYCNQSTDITQNLILAATKPHYSATFLIILLSTLKDFMIHTKFKKLFFIAVIFLAAVQFSYAQKTEIDFNVYSGLFSFRRDGATSNSWINFNPYITPDKYTSNPYGKKSEFSYAFELQGQRVAKNKNIYGLGISFETLTSKVNIDTVTENGFIYWQYPANGKTTLKNTFVTFNPFIGHRYLYGKTTFDLLAGFDLAFCLKSKEVGNASTNNKDYTTIENDKQSLQLILDQEFR